MGLPAYDYKTEPFSHQRRLLEETWSKKWYGLLWEQGTGKTKPIIDNAAILYREREIDCLLVVAPPGVERNWLTDEIPVHMPDDVQERVFMVHYATKTRARQDQRARQRKGLNHDGLLVVTISYQAFMTEHGKAFMWAVLQRRRCLFVCDEAHHIKTPRTKRVKSIIAAGRYASYRRIATGTPIGNSPFDIYSQIRFLKGDFWKERGMATFAAFKHHFGVWRTAEEVKREEGWDPGYDKLLGFKNMDELQEVIALIGDRVLKEDVLDLPPKLYSKRYHEMNADQRRAYKELREEFVTELKSGTLVEATLPIVRLLRLQQIICGYVAQGDEPTEFLGKTNPRLELVEDLRDSLGHPAIYWARFTKDVDQMMDVLGKEAVRYDGQISPEECERSKQAFQAGDAQWLVGNSAKGAEGLTMTQAKTVVYYSNSFRLITRQQSEDRAHRAGQEGAEHAIDGRMVNGVHYVDLCCADTVDDDIIDSLRANFNIAAQLTGDRLRSWL